MTGSVDGESLINCSFCGKSQRQVKKMVAGPAVYICEQCIMLCSVILVEEFQDEFGGPVDGVTMPWSELNTVALTLSQLAGRAEFANDELAREAQALASRLSAQLQIAATTLASREPTPQSGS